jgi:hypothetical protein
MGSLWLISTYFNPLNWSSRRRNYDIFRRHLGANLLTVEWSPSGQFQLTDRDADRLIQISGGDLMWQKERLINIGLSHLPDDCEFVGWVDCDILFLDPLWQQKTCNLLTNHEVIQLYGDVEYLEAGSPIPTDFRSSLRRPSIIQAWQSAENRDRFLEDQIRIRALAYSRPHYVPNDIQGSTGFAWAAQRSWLEAMGGLPDRWIAGTGDTPCALAFLGCHEAYASVLDLCGLGNIRSDHLSVWSRLAQVAPPRPSNLDGKILHLYHGELADRGYLRRLFTLVRSGFLPDEHLELAPGGAWRFNDAAPPGIRDLMAAYFASRREDGAPVANGSR